MGMRPPKKGFTFWVKTSNVGKTIKKNTHLGMLYASYFFLPTYTIKWGPNQQTNALPTKITMGNPASAGYC